MTSIADFENDPAKFFSALGPNLPRPLSFPKATDVSREARQRSTAIFAQWNALHDILDLHEDLIGRRWLKKTHGQRTTILLSAWPDMSKTHRPDFVALSKEKPKVRAQGSRFRDTFLWPYINVEDLVQSKNLLLFLNSRGRNLPESFVFADLEAVHLGIVSQAIQRPFLNQYTMLLYGQTVVENYGKLVAWDDDDRAFDWLFSGSGTAPADGLLLLEIQQKILDFLVKCCELILHDFSPSSFKGEAGQIQKAPSYLSPDPTAWASLSSIIAEAPYRLPGGLDLKRVQAIITAKRSAAQDHIWLLREDPGYFAETVKDYSDHRQETILSINGKSHPLLQTPTFWNRTLGDVITDAYGGFIIWDDLYKQVSKLEALAQRYPEPFPWDSTLPEEYSDQLHHFRYRLQKLMKGPIDSLKRGVPASPQLRSLFVREPQEKNSAMIKVKTKSGIGKNRLLWIFTTLWDEQQLFLYGLSNLMDELNRVLSTDAAERQNISSWVAEKLSDLSIIAEILRQLSLFQPWANTSETEAEKMEDACGAEFSRSMSDLAKIISGMKNLSVAEEGNPSSRSFYYPVDKRRTRQTVDDMRQAENRLDTFWNRVDQHFANYARGWSLSQSVPEDRQLNRTPAWVEEPRTESGPDVQEASQWPASPIRLNTAQEIHGLVPVTGNLPVRTKIKTRGVNHSELPQIGSGQPESIELDAQPRFIVGKRAFKVFSALFHFSSESDQPGEIPWLEFLHAMSSTGFTPEKLYGSVWQFTPTKLDVERSIQFHEPHPHHKIPFLRARRFGRRLNRAYGWTGSMFSRE